MIVEILKTDKAHNLKIGDLYEAETYSIDPSKVTLLYKLTKKNHKRTKKQKNYNQYLSEIKILNI